MLYISETTVRRIRLQFCEAGGDMIVRGITGSGGRQAGIEAPHSTLSVGLLGAVRVDIATFTASGDYRNYFLTTEHHHNVDQHTGNSQMERTSVAVLAHNACDADALSTALMVLGATTGQALIAQR